MLRYLPVILSLALTVYCAVDAIQTPDGAARTLPKIAWLILILLFPFIGPVAWLIAGRPRKGARGVPQQRRPRQHEEQQAASKDRTEAPCQSG